MRKENIFYSTLLVSLCAALLTGCDNGSNVATKVDSTSTTTSVTTKTDVTPKTADVRVFNGKGSYVAPSGPENVDVTISMKIDGTVSNVTLDSKSSINVSKKYQGLFLEGIKTQIIGKFLKDLEHVSVVNGSSLTSGGFNQALDQIKALNKA